MSSSTILVKPSNSPAGQVSTSGLVWQMARRDILTLFRTPWIIISRSMAFIIQLFVFAYFISGFVNYPGFFEYYAVGSVVAMVASISFVIGYDIFEEAEEGLLDYLLTLPVSRRQFIIGRALGGAVRSMIYVIPMFVIVAVLESFSNPLSILAAVLDLFLLAFGVTGLSITMAVTVRSANRFDVTLALLDLGVTRVSVALYPLAKLPYYVRPIAPFSPVTFASTSVYDALVLTSLNTVELAGLLAFVAVFIVLGATIYFKRLEGGVYA
jgi:ABC-2 type transport system permease protein